MDKKKVMALMLAASASAGTILIQDSVKAHADEHKSIGYVVNVESNLRVRSNPNTSSNILGYLSNGEKVNIIKKVGKWYEIDFRGSKGYVHGDYIREKSNASNSGTTSESGKGKVVNVSTSLRIRSGAGTNYSVIGYLYEGNTFDILGKSGSWYKIKHNGNTGYIHEDYVTKVSGNSGNDNSSESLGGKVGQVVNVSTSLRIRSGAGTSHSVIGYLSNGEKFNILGKSGSWYKISARGTTGYVHKDYVKIIGQGEDNNSSSNNTNELLGKTGKVVNVSSNLRVRNAPNTNSSVVAYLLEGQTFDILGKSGSWYKIKHNGITGYVHQDYVKIVGSSSGNSASSNNGNSGNNGSESLSEYGKVVNVSTSLRLRKEPNTSSSVVGYLFPGETFKITERKGNWYKVNANGKVGYASSDYIKLINKDEANNGSSTSASFETVYNLLKQQIGAPYIWGGKGEFITDSSLRMFKNMYPDAAAEGKYNIPSKYINNGYRAFDCSGLLYWGFKQVGINIGGSTYSQINAGREVSLNDVRPGDLLFYGNLQHVGMYIGNGKWIEAPKSHDYVKIANVPWSRIGRARRVLD